MEIYKSIESGNENQSIQLIKKLLSANIQQLPAIFQDQNVPMIDIRYTIKSNQETILIYACHYNRSNVVDFLLQHNANPDITDIHTNTCLIYTVANNNIDLTTKILGLTKLINLMNNYGQTALSYAVSKKHNQIVELLLNHEANPNVTDLYGNSPIHYACNDNNAECIHFLVTAGANINARNYSNISPLSISLKEKNLYMTRYLLDYGADVNMTDEHNNHIVQYLMGDTVINSDNVANNNFSKELLYYLLSFKLTEIQTPYIIKLLTYLIKKEPDIKKFRKILNNCFEQQVHLKTILSTVDIFLAVLNSPNYKSMIKILVNTSLGCDIDINKIPLALPVIVYKKYKKDAKLARWLFSKGWCVNVKDKDNKSMLYYALCNKDLHMIKYLYDRDVDKIIQEDLPAKDPISKKYLGFINYLFDKNTGKIVNNVCTKCNETMDTVYYPDNLCSNCIYQNNKSTGWSINIFKKTPKMYVKSRLSIC